MENENRPNQIMRLAIAALLAALCYVGFQFLRIDIPIGGGETTAVHFGNGFCVLAALLLGGSYGGLAGAVGMSIADITSAIYITSAPKTFFLKFCIGFITGTVAHRAFHLSEETSPVKVFRGSLIASIAGMAFNVVADPLVGYFYKTYLLGVQQDLASALAKITAVVTLVNALTSVLIAVLLYQALRPALKRLGIFQKLR
jgi:uncharacterized membrane protein